MTRTLLVALLFPIALDAQSRADGPISKGSMIVGGSAGVSITDPEGSTPSTTSISVFPSILYFVAPRLALGGSVGLSYASSDNSSTNGWSLGPAVRYYIAEPTATMLPFVGASALFGKQKFSSGGNPDITGTTTMLEGVGGITWLLVPHVGLNGELFVNHRKIETSGTPVVISDAKQLVYGLRLGISAFVF
jgi:hypothetical protein